MPVGGSSDGLQPNCNKELKRVTALITPQQLRSQYLFGITIADPNTGEEMPDSTLQQYIDNAVSMFEHYLDLSITPVRNFYEDRDYHFNQYVDWGFYQLNNFPVIQIRSIDLIYFRDESGNPEVVQTIPLPWIRLDRHSGIIRLIPNARFPANLQVSSSGGYFPEILRTQNVPHLWRMTYDYGFEDGHIPVLLNQAIAYAAAIQALIVAGNLVLGAGIASSSISLDGLSQSINTTQSAENSAYSATMKDYSNRLFGATKDDPFAIIKILDNFYKGESINLI